ncbi:hypothetical protein C8A00DRAFT_44937 [Chaetomidium leptoderma]|uniref:Peptidase S8/S53 domain-containing protein n=1 Tax=Chaetomidium leptoderma TaxID=669021 RepID=A0AAN6ZVS3_9PEZI|nr:hypothetical protein C8A00DRAFT_44937 [Chaetomidium leptoderma]
MAPDSEKDFDPEVDDFSVEAFDDGNDFFAKREVNYEERFRAASKEIKRKKTFANDREVEEFLRQYDDVAGKSVARVVKHTDDVEPGDVELLVRRMVERWPSLLGDVNKDEHNPVFMAIRNSQHALVGYMISACKDRDRLESALSKKAPDGNTCLHAALKETRDVNPNTIRMLIESATDDVLAVQDDVGMTPMHYAVSFNQCNAARADLIALFIDRDLKALQKSVRSQQTFLDVRAMSGRSVYREHENSRAPIAKRYEEHLAKKRQATGANKQGQAARSAPRDLRDKARDSRQGGSAEPNGGSSTDKYGSNGDADDGLDERERLRQIRKAEEAKEKGEETKRPAQPVRAGNSSRNHEPAPNTPLKRRSTARFDSNLEQEKQKEKERVRPAPKSRGSSHGEKTMIGLLKNSDAILLRLKLHYMRMRSAEMAISFLYGNNIDDFQISFDYDRLPRKMLWNEFVKRFGADAQSGLRFDRVLQYVTFPRVQVTLKGRRADMEREAELQSGVRQVGKLGRKDMQYFFDWLYKKGVRHIIRVSVEDSGDSGETVHSDQAIQESLERFIVEHLDWKKTDLDPETILRVSSKVNREAPTPENPMKTEIVSDRQLKQLYLRWSGNNAVLRGWSEPEGLAMLPYLQSILLFTPPADKTYDNEPWIRAKIDDFEAKLIASRQAARAQAQTLLPVKITAPGVFGVGDISSVFGDVEVIRMDSVADNERKVRSLDAPHLTSSAPVKGVNSHRWLDSTARFAGGMIPFWETTVNNFLESRQNRHTLGELEKDVVLALIDDGVDMFDTPETNQILEGKSFDFHGGKVRPPFSSAKGHGTVMASMILRVCPMVKIYPIRLKTYENAKGKNMNIDAGYAAQAIQAALDKKAAIISMSWTVPMSEGDSEAKKRLHNVLKTAVERRVLMFCSAPDEGKFTELDYPSGPWRDRFFRIGAAGSDGSVFQWTPDDGITYVIPGVDVVREQAANRTFDPHSGQGIPNRMVEFHETGSSVATALGAGLAAMIIYCVKASILAVKTVNNSNSPLLGILPDNAAELIAHPDEMKRAFASLGKVTPNNFVQIWDELDKISEQLEVLRAPSSTPEAKLKCTNAFVDFGQRLWGAARQEH